VASSDTYLAAQRCTCVASRTATMPTVHIFLGALIVCSCYAATAEALPRSIARGSALRTAAAMQLKSRVAAVRDAADVASGVLPVYMHLVEAGCSSSECTTVSTNTSAPSCSKLAAAVASSPLYCDGVASDGDQQTLEAQNIGGVMYLYYAPSQENNSGCGATVNITCGSGVVPASTLAQWAAWNGNCPTNALDTVAVAQVVCNAILRVV